MKLQNYNIELKNISKVLFEDSDEIMYLYYTLSITNTENGKEISFTAYDFPQVKDFKLLVSEIDDVDVLKYRGLKYQVCQLTSPFGLEHSIRLEKYNQNNRTWYNVHIYEEFGNSVVISYLTKDELVEISEYFEEEIKNARLG